MTSLVPALVQARGGLRIFFSGQAGGGVLAGKQRPETRIRRGGEGGGGA
jgi:hypothetical protein